MGTFVGGVGGNNNARAVGCEGNVVLTRQV